MLERRALVISLGLSLLSMYLVYNYIDTKEKVLLEKYGPPFRKMVVARRDILQYETIRPTDVEEITVPNAMIPPGMIENAKDVVDAVAAVPIMKREQILDNKIVSKNIYSGLDNQIALGKRAISVAVNVKTSASYMIRPGNRVDLAAHFEYKTKGNNYEETKIFLQDVLVLAAGKTVQPVTPKGVDQSLINQVERDKKVTIRQDVQETLNYVKTDINFQTVTLEVTPEQAQRVAYVSTVYPESFVLLLRNADDRQVARTATTTFPLVMGEDSYYARPKKEVPIARPRLRFNDYLGTSEVPVFNKN